MPHSVCAQEVADLREWLVGVLPGLPGRGQATPR
jgi:hypothetical protein